MSVMFILFTLQTLCELNEIPAPSQEKHINSNILLNRFLCL